MSIADELQKLQALCREGALTDDEFVQAKAALLAGSSVPPHPQSTEDLVEQLAAARRQIELMRIDQDWETEQKNYLVWFAGDRIIPTTLRAWAFGLLGMLLGAGLIIADFSAESRFFTIWGISFITVWGAFGLYVHFRARAYAIANQAYLRRRGKVTPEQS